MAKHVAIFARVVFSSLYSRILKVQVANTEWTLFEQSPLNTNFGRRGMKKLMEELEGKNMNSVYYSSSARI